MTFNKQFAIILCMLFIGGNVFAQEKKDEKKEAKKDTLTFTVIKENHVSRIEVKQ